MTLAQFGQQVGLSASYLSQIERGAMSPSLSRLTAIAKALGLQVRDFFEDDSAPSFVVRAHQGKLLRSDDRVRVELLSADPAGKSIFPYRLVCQPGSYCERPSTYPGDECAFVLRGQLTVTLGEERIVLNAGDSIHYQRHEPHCWSNEGEGECVVIWTASPPIPEAEFQG